MSLSWREGKKIMAKLFSMGDRKSGQTYFGKNVPVEGEFFHLRKLSGIYPDMPSE